MRIGSGLWAIAVMMACGGAATRNRDSGAGGGGASSVPVEQGGKSGVSSPGKPKPIGGAAGTTSVASGGSGPMGGGATQGGAGPIATAGSPSTGERGSVNSFCTKTADCLTDAYCGPQMVCVCPLNLPDFCPDPNDLPGACVSRKTDPKHCGLCSRACPQGAGCNAGKCTDAPTEVIGTSECGQMRLVVQGQTLYFTKPLSGEVKAYPLTPNSELVDLTDPLQGTPTAIVADADGVYWVDQGNGTPGSSKVLKKSLPLTDAAPIALATSPTPANVLALAVKDKRLYYALGHDVHAISTDPAQVTDDVVATATNYNVQPPQPAGNPSALWLTPAGAVCWTAAESNAVESDGIEPGNDAGYTDLAHSVGSLLLSSVYCSTTFAYFANGERLQHSNGTPSDLAQTPNSDSIAAFAIGPTSAYFAGEAGGLYRQSLDADIDVPPTAMAANQSVITAITLDDARVYWATDQCSIRSLPQ